MQRSRKAPSAAVPLDRVAIRDRARTRFSARRVTDEYEAVYAKVLAGGGAPTRTAPVTAS